MTVAPEPITTSQKQKHWALSIPLQHRQFRRMWIASFFSNFGFLIQGVGATWAKTIMTNSAATVALVQTALMLPIALLSLVAGALADMFDRRKIAIAALCGYFLSAASLTLCAAFGLLNPSVILTFCFVAGCGMALFIPAWQSSVGEQVPAEALAPAVALNGVSFNLARTFGPAIGGLIVAWRGPLASFAANSLLCLPLLMVLYHWRRSVAPARLPSERLGRAIISGVRYAIHSSPVRIVIARTLLHGIAGGSLIALMPIVARELLGGDARLYGVMLGCFGIGAVIGAFVIEPARRRLSNNAVLTLATIVLGVAIIGVGFSRTIMLTTVAVAMSGGAWIMIMTLFNATIQLSVPRWVVGRSVALYQSTVAMGTALGGAIWGHIASDIGVDSALFISGGCMLCSLLIGIWLQMPQWPGSVDGEAAAVSQPEVRMPITERSGPIIIEIAYRVASSSARPFYRQMQQVQEVRQRNGGYSWSLSRDIAEPECWTERFHCPTWLDYIRLRNRSTQRERAIEQNSSTFQMTGHPIRVRLLLERPFGSVRWRDATPDQGVSTDDVAGQ